MWRIALLVFFLSVATTFAAPTRSAQIIDQPLEAWVAMIETESSIEIEYDSAEIGSPRLSLELKEPVGPERIKSAFVLLLALLGIDYSETDGKAVLSRESDILDAAFERPLSERLPNGWMQSPNDTIESIALDGATLDLALAMMSELVDAPILYAGDFGSRDTVTFQGGAISRDEFISGLVTSLEGKGYRFLFRDGFLLLRDRPFASRSSASAATQETEAEIKARMQRVAEEIRRRRQAAKEAQEQADAALANPDE